MSDLFAPFWPALHAREGGATYTNRAADRGGPTKHGVTAKKLGEWRGLGRDATAAEVQALEESEAYQLYRSDFFVKPGFEAVSKVSPRIAEELLDTAVNMGPRHPSIWLQEALNLCNQQGRHWKDIVEDGRIGSATVAALEAMVRRRGLRMTEDVLLRCLNGDQVARYKAITRSGGPNSDQEQNFVGWIAQRVGFD